MDRDCGGDESNESNESGELFPDGSRPNFRAAAKNMQENWQECRPRVQILPPASTAVYFLPTQTAPRLSCTARTRGYRRRSFCVAGNDSIVDGPDPPHARCEVKATFNCPAGLFSEASAKRDARKQSPKTVSHIGCTGRIDK